MVLFLVAPGRKLDLHERDTPHRIPRAADPNSRSRPRDRLCLRGARRWRIAAVMAFSAAAALTIGAYVMLSALPLSCVFWFLRRRINRGTQRRATRWIAGVLLLLVAGSVLAAVFTLAGAMMIINAAILLTALLGAGILTALRIVGFVERRFDGSLT